MDLVSLLSIFPIVFLNRIVFLDSVLKKMNLPNFHPVSTFFSNRGLLTVAFELDILVLLFIPLKKTLFNGLILIVNAFSMHKRGIIICKAFQIIFTLLFFLLHI